MKYSILLFASLQDEWQSPSIEIELPEAATAQNLLDAVRQLKPELADRLSHVRVANGEEFCSPASVLDSKQDIALIPPVSGG